MVERASREPVALAQWWARALGDAATPRHDGSWLVQGLDRRLLVSIGETKTVPSICFGISYAAQWREYRGALQARGVTFEPVPTRLQSIIGNDAFALRDPDGRLVVFATNIPPQPASVFSMENAFAARLQHFVCASVQTHAMLAFYRDVLGFVESDRVVDEKQDLSAAFVRSDAEHHSFAVFRAPASGADHHAYEAPDWNAIRDWADHLGALEIPLWWGPGRHGVGNNLFFMIEDPEGYKLEISAELERMTETQAYRTWPHGQRALNLWGNAWMRS